jgi:hypothetical protein
MGGKSGIRQNSGNKGEIRSTKGYAWDKQGMENMEKDKGGKDGVRNVTSRARGCAQ